jgi:glutathione peroxidase
MKILIILLGLLISKSTSVYDFKVKDIDGKEISLDKFKGKKILIVNVASQCGNTPQYETLEKLYEANKDHLVIIGFPANNFGEQEPGSNAEIKQFCSSKYNVTFPIMSKVSVKGNDIAPIFTWLINEPNPDFTGDIKWNFEKFLIDENGKLIRRFRSKVQPMSDEIVAAVKAPTPGQ